MSPICKLGLMPLQNEAQDETTEFNEMRDEKSITENLTKPRRI